MMRKRIHLIWFFLFPMILTFGTGCTGDDDDTPGDDDDTSYETDIPDTTDTPSVGDDDTSDATEQPQPAITIDSPEDGATVQIPFDLEVTVENFMLDDAAVGGANQEGYGHWHVLVDGAYLEFAASSTFTITELEAGDHTIGAMLVHNDHTELSPSASDEITVTVEAALEPAITITSPTDGADMAPEFTVTVEVQDFTLSDAVGAEPVEGQGHWHLNVDGAYLDLSTSNSLSVSGLSPGSHTLQAALVGNDHAALDPPAESQSITVQVAETVPPASIAIISPEDGTVDFPLTVTVDIQNFILEPSLVGGDPEEGHGHWHLNIDGAYYDYSAYDSLEVASGLTPGSHTFQAELVNNNHTSLDPPVQSQLVTVDVGAPTIQITVPSDGNVGDTFTVEVAVTNFVLDPEAIGNAENVAGTGHWHLDIDGAYDSASGTTTTTVAGLAPGTHTLLASLHNNDHSPLSPAVESQTVTVTVVGDPVITLLSPTGGDVENVFVVTVEVGNFELSDDVGGAVAEGLGHWHLEIDGEYADLSTDTSLEVGPLAPGQYTLRAQLVNNDHTYLEPAVYSQEVSITVLEPSIEIVGPADGTLTGPDVTLEIAVSSFVLDPGNIGGDNSLGHGHYHIYVNGEYLGASGSTYFLIEGLEPANHQVEVRLTNNDHTELDPVVRDIIEITSQAVDPNAPTLTILSPGDLEEIDSTSVEIQVETTQFTLDPEALGGDNVEATGHYHVYYDGVYAGAEADNTFFLGGLQPGWHSLKVTLANNDHTELVPEVSDAVDVLVVASAPGIWIVGPEDGADVAQSFDLTVQVDNFTLDPEAIGGADVAGEGHYHIYVDGTYYLASASATNVVSLETEGAHEISVELVTNSHSNLDPRVLDAISVSWSSSSARSQGSGE